MKRTLLAASLFALGIAACASTPESRIGKQQARFNSYPPEIQQKLRLGQIDVGYYPDMVEIALGEPTRKYSRTGTQGSSEVWAYQDDSPHFSFGVGGGSFGRSGGLGGGVGLSTGDGDYREDKIRVVFVDGVVSSVERSLK